VAAQADGPEGGLVDHVGQVRPHAAGGGLGDLVQVHVLRQPDLPGVDLEGGQTAGQVGPVHGDPPVKAAGTEQGLVQHLRPVGGGQDDDALGWVEAVHLRQELVQGLLPLVVAAEAGVSRLADGVDLIDEDDAGGHLGRLLEQVPDAAGAHAHEHLHEAGAGDGEEGDPGLTGHGLGQQGLAGAGGANQQGAPGELGADGGVFARVVEEVDDLLQGLLGLVLAGHVGKGDAGGLLHVYLGVGLAHAADAADAAAALGHQIHQQHEGAHHQHRGEDIAEHKLQHRRDLRHIGVPELHAVGRQEVAQVHVVDADLHGEERYVVAVGPAVLVGVDIALHRGDLQHAVGEEDLCHVALLHQLQELAVGDLVGGGGGVGLLAVGRQVVEHHRQHHGPPQQHQQAVEIFLVLVLVRILI